MTLYSILATAGGFVLLFLGGEILLRGALGLARAAGLSPLLIGLTVVAAATSMPELVVTLTAGLAGAPDVAVGNIVGSNIANVLLILGTAAAIWPIATRPRIVVRDAGAVLIATAAFVGFALIGPVGRAQGVAFLLMLGLYLWFSAWTEIRERNRNAAEPEAAAPSEDLRELGVAPRPVWLSLVFIAGGAAGLVVGSELLVDGAVAIARAAGISESVIGLTLIAVGTSLPELATAIVAAYRRHSDVALGNALGSNIFNLLLVYGALSLATPVSPAPEVLRFDMWVMAGVTLAVIPVMLITWRIGRGEGLAFLALYAAYVLFQFGPAPAG
jgi:cation:H+ antiporter